MVIRGGQHPEWDSEVRFTVLKGNGPEGKHRKLEVACYSQEHKKEDLLGKATVDISDTLKTGEFDGVCYTFADHVLPLNEFRIDWVSLDVDGVVRGDIYLEMTYYAHAPAPGATPNNKLLASGQGIPSARPSKLSPSDRLSRPINQNVTQPSRFPPKQPSRPHDQPSSTSSHAVPPIRKNGPLSDLLADETVRAGAALNTRDRRSYSQPQVAPSTLAAVPSILRPGVERYSPPISEPRQQRNFMQNRTSPESSISTSSRLQSTIPHVSLSPPNPYIGGSSKRTSAHSGFSDVDSPSSLNPYTGYMSGQQYQQVSGGRAYSSVPPGAFIVENTPGPDKQSYPSMSHVKTLGAPNIGGAVIPNPYIGGNTFIPVGQQQASNGQAYSLAPPTVPVQVSGSGSGSVYLPENRPGPNVPSYSSAVSVQTSVLSNIDRSAPTDPRNVASDALIAGSQQAPDGRVYSSASPVNTVQTSGHPVSSGSLGFPMPVFPLATEPYGYQEPSLYMRPDLGDRSESLSYYRPPPPPPRTNVISDRSDQGEELDPYHLARYKTPLPLPGSLKENTPPLPPLPPLPSLPPLPRSPTSPPPSSPPAHVSSSPPAVAPAPAPDPTRVEALRKIEQDAAWRREQELKDLELAMELDRELNL